LFLQLQLEGESKQKRSFTIERRSKDSGAIQVLVSTAYETQKERSSKGRVYKFDIDAKYLKEIYESQNGRCFYSGMPLVFGEAKTEWKIGLERLDPMSKGYEKGNVALVCQEFNAIDRSYETKMESGGWTQDKFRYFMNFVKEKYADK